MPPSGEPRSIKTQIHIDSEGRWSSEGTPIVNEQVLAFFKAALQADTHGVYIYNEFGPLREKAYIQVEGPVMKVQAISAGELTLETGEAIQVEQTQLVRNSAGRIYASIPRLGCWAIFSRQAVIDLTNGLEKSENDHYFWRGIEIGQNEKIEWAKPRG